MFPFRSNMPDPRPIRVELRRQALDRNGVWETYAFSFIHGRKKVVFIQARDMPAEDVAADWPFAWFEVAKVNGLWKGLRRLSGRGDEAWTPESPDHAATGGSVLKVVPHHAVTGRYPPGGG